jgi:hypothetical protein
LKLKAEGMLEDAADAALTRDKLKGLTEAQVIKGYKLGLITMEKAKTWLSQLGNQAEAVNITIALADAELQDQLLNVRLENIRDTFLAGGIDRQAAQDRLGKLDVPGEMITKLMGDWDEAKDKKDKGPTKADVEAWYEHDLIDLVELATELSLLGYADRYVIRYVEMARLRKVKAGTKPVAAVKK